MNSPLCSDSLTPPEQGGPDPVLRGDGWWAVSIQRSLPAAGVCVGVSRRPSGVVDSGGSALDGAVQPLAAI